MSEQDQQTTGRGNQNRNLRWLAFSLWGLSVLLLIDYIFFNIAVGDNMLTFVLVSLTFALILLAVSNKEKE